MAGLLAVAILVGAGLGYFVAGSNPQGQTFTSTATKTITTTFSATTLVTVVSFFPDLGSHLQLTIEMNATTIRYEGAIGIQVILRNPVASNLTASVPKSSNPVFSTWNWTDFICGGGPGSSVMSFALFQGHYVAENLSLAGEPLTLVPPLRPPCLVSTPPSYLIYLPSSSSAWAYSGYSGEQPFKLESIASPATEVCSTNSGGGTSCEGSSGLFGYWQGSTSGPNGNYNTSSPNFHWFSPGQYTLVAEDAWEHQAFGYFEVVALD